jgi:hypothetical protein
MLKEIEVETSILPNKAFYQKRSREIVGLNSKCVIRKYKVVVDDNKIQKVLLNTKHPNCHPKTKEFCLPKSIIGKEFNRGNRKIIETILRQYNLDDCYYKNWADFKLKEN